MSTARTVVPFNQQYSAGWIADGQEEPEFYELFTGVDAEQRSRTFLIDTFAWLACDEVDTEVADLYWEAADYLVRFGVGKSFRKNIRGITYWRKRVTVFSGSRDVHIGSPE